jgi:hypothetical protein
MARAAQSGKFFVTDGRTFPFELPHAAPLDVT